MASSALMYAVPAVVGILALVCGCVLFCVRVFRESGKSPALAPMIVVDHNEAGPRERTALRSAVDVESEGLEEDGEHYNGVLLVKGDSEQTCPLPDEYVDL